MKHTISHKTPGDNWQLIDYLEDPGFRAWVLHAESLSDARNTIWEKEVEKSKEARQARYILQALKAHFEENQLSDQEIDERLNREIDKYRVKHKSLPLPSPRLATGLPSLLALSITGV